MAVLEARIKFVEEKIALPKDDPRRYMDSDREMLQSDSYPRCWEAIRQYLRNQPSEKLLNGSMDKYLDLLERYVRRDPNCPSCAVEGTRGLYALYKEKALTKQASELRNKYKQETWWFDDYDRNH